MRYPQYFATKAIERGLEEGMKKGVIWHTQGSGKTALAFSISDIYETFMLKEGLFRNFTLW